MPNELVYGTLSRSLPQIYPTSPLSHEYWQCPISPLSHASYIMPCNTMSH